MSNDMNYPESPRQEGPNQFMRRTQNLLQHMNVAHFTNDEFGFNARCVTEMVSEDKSRVYGVLATLMRVGLIAASLYREKK